MFICIDIIEKWLKNVNREDQNCKHFLDRINFLSALDIRGTAISITGGESNELSIKGQMRHQNNLGSK